MTRSEARQLLALHGFSVQPRHYGDDEVVGQGFVVYRKDNPDMVRAIWPDFGGHELAGLFKGLAYVDWGC